MAAKTIVTGYEKSTMFRSYSDDGTDAASAAQRGRGSVKDLALMQVGVPARQ